LHDAVDHYFEVSPNKLLAKALCEQISLLSLSLALRRVCGKLLLLGEGKGYFA
jgi:hypothetical protein